MRWFWTAAAGLVAWVGLASSALACSCGGVCNALVLPSGGAVPANLPAFLRVGISTSATAPRLVSDEGHEIAMRAEEVPMDLQSRGGFGFDGATLYRLAEPMVEGHTYRWTTLEPEAECRGGAGIDSPVEILALAPQPLPGSAGTASLLTAPRALTASLSADSQCEATTDLIAATYELAPDSTWEPWSAVRYEISRVNGQIWRPRSSVCTPPALHSLAGALREEVFVACGPNDSLWALGDTHPTFFTEGERTLEMGLWLPGMEQIQWTQPLSLSLSCGAASEQADGCQQRPGSPAQSSPWACLLALALALRAERRRAGGRV